MMSAIQNVSVSFSPTSISLSLVDSQLMNFSQSMINRRSGKFFWPFNWENVRQEEKIDCPNSRPCRKKGPLSRKSKASTRSDRLPSESHNAEEKIEQPRVVFFPTGPQGSGNGGGCQDSDGGGGFNTFSFLSFLLTAINAISVVSNNINNRRNNNNNNNNDDNNNQFSTLDTSTLTTQTVSRKRRSKSDPESLSDFLSFYDFIDENRVYHKLESIAKALFRGSGNCNEDEVGHANDLTDSLAIAAHFTKAWVQLTFLENNRLCHDRVLCEANALANTEMKRIVAETLSYAIITKLGAKNRMDLDTSTESVLIGQNSADRNVCQLRYKCPESEWSRSSWTSTLFDVPFKIWQMTEQFFFPYYLFNKSQQCKNITVKLFAQSQRPLPLNATPTIVGVAVPGDGRTVNASSQIESWVKQKVAINIVDDHIEKDISLHGQNGT